ncbi:hypothetical protein VNO77_18403 [Canavalia gladiata]|uniref:Uncharacterized protein n=1 Tax=Canavalia gladiata TaxID=3824 RepID=A0AAN9LKV0_CANGL
MSLMPLYQRTFQVPPTIAFLPVYHLMISNYFQDWLRNPNGRKFKENKRESNSKYREETEEKRGQSTLVVGGLLAIAFVVPMAQYYAYAFKK